MGADIILVYSLGPCGAAGGVCAGGVRNACVALPPGPYEPGGGVAGAAGGAAGTAGGAPDSDPGPNMRVYSPSSCRGGGAAAAGGACGNCDAEGNCGPVGIPPGVGLKNSVNSPPLGGVGPASGRAADGAWNMRVNSPASCGLAAAGGQSPCAGTSGIGEWNMRVNSPGPDDDGATGRAGGAGGGDCEVPAPTGGMPGTGEGGAT